MKRLSIIFILLIIFSGLSLESVFAASEPSIQMPNHVQIEKKTDVSYNVLHDLFGSVIETVMGENGTKDPKYGAYGLSSVIDMLMGALNFCALAFLSCGILYTFAIGAITTAHEGKKLGGSIYNSLWVPVRAAMSFSLCVPVTHGYSLLQIAILTMIGFGINFGNLAWDQVGNYLVNINANVTGKVSGRVKNEAVSLIEPLFRSALTFEIVTNSMRHEPNQPQIKEKTGQTIEINSKNRPYLVIDDAERGVITIQMWTTGKSVNYNDYGTVVVPRPKAKDFKAGQDNSVAEAKLKIAKARAQGIIDMWEKLRLWARKAGVEEYNILGDNVDIPSPPAGGEIIRAFENTVGNAIESNISKIQTDSALKFKDKLSYAIDSKNGKSEMGWATAGLFSYALSKVYSEIEEVAFTGPSTFDEPTIIVDNSKVYSALLAFSSQFTNLNEKQKTAIKTCGNYVSEYVLGKSYFDNDVNPTSNVIGRTINMFITELWWDTSWSESDKNGVLETTLSKFKKDDPVLVMYDMGRRFYRLGFVMVSLKLSRDMANNSTLVKLGKGVIALISLPVAIGGMILDEMAGAIMDNALWTTLMWIFLAIGFLFKFLAPLTPLAIWAYAFLNWILRVIETLIAAPVWAVAHAMPEGHGFAGNSARQGYFLVLDVAFRPILMVVGALISVALWKIAGYAFAELAGTAVNAFTSINDSDFDTQTILSVAIMVLFWYIYTKIFVALIFTFPERLMSWIGKSGGGSLVGNPESMGDTFNRGLLMINSRHDALVITPPAKLGA